MPYWGTINFLFFKKPNKNADFLRKMENRCAFWQNRKTALPQQHSATTHNFVLWGKAVFLIFPKSIKYTIWRGTRKIPERQSHFPNFFLGGSLHSVPLAAHFLRFFSDYILKNRRRNDGKHIICNRFGKEKGPRRGAPGPNPVLLNILPFWRNCFALCQLF